MSSLSPAPGWVLREPEGNVLRRLLIVGIAAPLALMALGIFTGSGLALVIGVVVLAAVAVASRHSLAAMLRWNQPQLEVWAGPFPLGSVPTVVYHRRPKRPTDIAESTIECRLTCQERATYTQGTDTVTDTRKVVEQDCNTTGHGTADGLRAEIDMPISAHAGAPSFDLGHNEVSWYLQVRVQGVRLPRDKHTFLIHVGPELDPSLRAGRQDS